MRIGVPVKFLLTSVSWMVAAGFPVNPSTSTKTTTTTTTSARAVTALHAGFGGGIASKNKKKNNKKTGKVVAPFDAGASLLRMEKIYDELSQNETKRLNRDDTDSDHDDPDEIVTSEYMIAARASPMIADWVPVAQIILARPHRHAVHSEGARSDALVRAAISLHCREISHVAGAGSRVFTAVARHDMQYAVESVESFHKHVYQVAMQGKHENNGGSSANGNAMSKAEARRLLQLDNNDPSSSSSLDDMATLKRTYRKLSMEWHPDRFVGQQSNEAKEHAAARYAQIKLAYETLQSGMRNGNKLSWYESLGGRERTDFTLLPELQSMAMAEAFLTERQARAAVCGLDPAMVQTFVARSQAAVAK